MSEFLASLRKKIYKAPITFAYIAFVSVAVSLLMIVYVYQQAGKSKATGETVSLSFNPTSVAGSQGQDFSTTIQAQPSVDINMRGYNFGVSFDKTKVQVKDIQYKLGAVSAGLGDDNSKLSTINANGIIKIQGEIQTSTGQAVSVAAPTDVVAITFTSNSSAAYSISYDTTGANFYKINVDYSLVGLPCTSVGDLAVNGGGGPSNTPGPPTGTPGGPTDTPGPGGNVTLNLKLKFQGILSKPKVTTIPVKVSASLPLGPIVSSSENFTVDDQGIWSGSVTLSGVVPGPGYKIFVKGPKHLQKRTCGPTPQESFPGTYHCENGAITLNAGSNSFDFSGIYQLVGDLPKQDGVVNSYDISLVRNNVGSTDPAVLALADLNLDGIVDSQDYSLVIAALSVRADEGQ